MEPKEGVMGTSDYIQVVRSPSNNLDLLRVHTLCLEWRYLVRRILNLWDLILAPGK